MSELRQRMIDAMVQRGFAQRTQETYIQAIVRMVKYYRRDPASYTPEEVQAQTRKPQVSGLYRQQTRCQDQGGRQGH